MMRILHGTHRGRLGLCLGLFAIALSIGSCREDDMTRPSAAGTDDTKPVLAGAAAAVAVPAFRQISSFDRHTCAITPDNRVYCWGRNSSGQLGDGTSTRRLLPVAVMGALRFRQVSTGVSHTCGVTMGDLAYCWGNNPFGQLGEGTTTRRMTPTKVMGGLTFREVTTGTKHTCGVTLGNVVYCWGDNSSGQLGIRTFGGTRLVPTRIAGTTMFSQISAGSQHTCGVTPGTMVFCWGLNNLGQLGDGTNTNRALRTRVMSDQSFSRVESARLHTCAVNLDNLGYCWGDNSFDKLGVDNDGGFADTRVPLAVTGGLRFLQIDGGSSHSCGLTTSNLAKCWGWNSSGQLGDGGTSNSFGPKATAITLQLRQITTGFNHTCGVTLDDKAYCWGSNDEGELGVGTTLMHTIAIPVGGRPADSRFVVVWFRSDQNGSVNPAVDTVSVGQAITWVWSGGGTHNVQSIGSPSFASSPFMKGTGKQYKVTFNARGTYTYRCERHPTTMTGRVLVR